MRKILMTATVMLAGCASEPKTDVAEWDRQAPVEGQTMTTELDVLRSLGLTNRPIEELGAIEKTFNSCSLQPHTEPCATRYVTLVHYQLLCRDTDGTVSDTPIALEPIQANEVKWNVGELKGSSRTDARGYGELIMMSDRSLLEQHLTLRLGPKFLGLTVGEITKVVLPKMFCRGA